MINFWQKIKSLFRRRLTFVIFTMRRNDVVNMSRNLRKYVAKFDQDENLNNVHEIVLCKSKDHAVIIRMDKAIERKAEKR